MRLTETFTRLAAQDRKAFVAYLTAGDPSLDGTARFLEVLARAGADIVELGIPFSDPIADGPINQRAANRALQSGTTLRSVLALVALAREQRIEIPIVLFTYFNPVLRMGLETFARCARQAGVDGVLIVDLPVEEAEHYRWIMDRHRIDTVFLASPTTDPERLTFIAQATSGFLYYVSRTGVTGTSNELSQTLDAELAVLRARFNIPICVGFGISTPEQVAAAARLASGVVVGSALVQEIETSASEAEAVRRLENITRRLAAPLIPRCLAGSNEEKTC